MRHITYKQEAQLRLAAWGAVARSLSMSMGPSLNPYAKQPFLSDRVDCDEMRSVMDHGDRLDSALQVDEWLNFMKVKSPLHYVAADIWYVQYPFKHQAKERIAEWKRKTGFKKTRFYLAIRAVEADIALSLQRSD